MDVLICDTADEVARLQYALLRAAPDLATEGATDPFQAVDAAMRTRPAVIVCDLELPDVGGNEFVRRLRATAPGSHVLARGSASDAHTVAGTLAAGAAGYLLKTDGPDAVLAAIRAVAAGSAIVSAGAAAPLGAELLRQVSRIGELEDELAALKEDVSQGTTAKADFLANISHELRTPVTVAKGIAYVLRNPNVPPAERDQFLEQLQSSLDKLMGIVDEVITLAELERGTFTLELAVTDLGPLVRHAVDEVGRAYPDVPMTAHVPNELFAIADGGRVGGVVHELLDNACRYSPPGRGIELVARVLDEGVVVAVTDHGEGLDRGVAAQAFAQPFTTGEGTLRKEKAGVGVGLHLARQIVIQHGGILWSDPLAGGGTRISFCIPSHEGAHLAVPPAGAVGAA